MASSQQGREVPLATLAQRSMGNPRNDSGRAGRRPDRLVNQVSDEDGEPRLTAIVARTGELIERRGTAFSGAEAGQKPEPLRSRCVKPLQQSFKLLVLQTQQAVVSAADLFIQSSNFLGQRRRRPHIRGRLPGLDDFNHSNGSGACLLDAPRQSLGGLIPRRGLAAVRSRRWAAALWGLLRTGWPIVRGAGIACYRSLVFLRERHQRQVCVSRRRGNASSRRAKGQLRDWSGPQNRQIPSRKRSGGLSDRVRWATELIMREAYHLDRSQIGRQRIRR